MRWQQLIATQRAGQSGCFTENQSLWGVSFSQTTRILGLSGMPEHLLKIGVWWNWKFDIYFAKDFLKNGSMSFTSTVLPMTFRRNGHTPNVMWLQKDFKIFTYKFRGRIHYDLTRGSGPAQPHLDYTLDKALNGPIWCNHGYMEVSGQVDHVIQVENLSLRIGKFQTINSNSILEIQRLFNGSRTTVLRTSLHATHGTLQIQNSIWKFTGATLLFQQKT